MKNTVVKVGVAVAVLAVVGILAAGAVVFVLDRLQKPTMASSQPAVDPQKKAALDSAFQAGLMSQDEYNAKLKALSAASAPAKPASAPSAAKGGFKDMTVVDPMFGVPAYRVRIPADWKFEGAVVRSPCESDQLVWRAESPDGLTGAQSMPKVHWLYSENAQVLATSNKACGVHAPVAAAQQASVIAAGTRPSPQIVTVEPWKLPGLDERLAANNQAYEKQAASFGWPASRATHSTGDGARVRIRYNYQGHAEEEWLMVWIVTTSEPVATVGSGQYGIIKTNWDHRVGTDTNVTAVRAPEGSLDATFAMAKEMGPRPVPGYIEFLMALQQKAFNQAQAIAQKSFDGLMDKARMDARRLSDEHTAYMNATTKEYAQHNAQFQIDLDNKDRNNKNFVDYAANRTYYVNPETGATGTIQNAPGGGGYAVPSTTPGWWVQLQPILH